MAVRLELRVRHRGCCTEQFLGQTSLLQIAGERGSDTFLLRAADSQALDQALAIAEDAVGHKADVLHRTDITVLFRGRNLETGIVAAIRRSRCTILWPIVYRDGLEFYTLVAPTRVEARALTKQIESMGDVEVLRAQDVAPAELEPSVPLAGLLGTLTPRQYQALDLAIHRGYYAAPRRITAGALAHEMGVSPSTYCEHLRKAEDQLLRTVAGLVESYPALADAARRRPGRPRKNL